MKSPKRFASLSRFSKRNLLIVAGIMAVAGTAAIVQSFAYRTAGAGFGIFYAQCDYVRTDTVDPIVFPGQTSASHSHDFFGAANINENSTTKSIQQGATNCNRFGAPENAKVDKSAYWVPTMYVDGQPVHPKTAAAFYKPNFKILKDIEPFPAGLVMIAGKAKTDIEGPEVINNGYEGAYYWECAGGNDGKGSSTVAPTCGDNQITLYMYFPDCWDGLNVDSADHKSHMAYSHKITEHNNTRVCPSSHPHEVPTLMLVIRYETHAGPTTKLSSGSMATAHADFMNGWDQQFLTGLVQRCLQIDNYCGGEDNPVVGHGGNNPADEDSAETKALLASLPTPTPTPTIPDPTPDPTPTTPTPIPDTTKPATSITAPANGATVSSTTNVTVNASDNKAVTKVELYINNTLVATPDVAAPYVFSWNTTAYNNGAHILVTKAYDEAGNVATSPPVTATVNNVAAPTQLKAGDVNSDGHANFADLKIILDNWKKGKPPGAPATRAQGDLNGDGVVNVRDLSILSANYEGK